MLPGLLVFLAPLFACGEGRAAPPGSGLVILPHPTQGPEVDERPYFHDFGTVLDGEVVEHVFRLENTDPEPVTIKRIVPGCGCSIPKVSYTTAAGEIVPGKPVSPDSEELLVVPPGAIADLAIQVDTRDIQIKNQDKLVTITVTTDSPNAYYMTLETHILVARAFEIVPQQLMFGPIPISAGAEKSVEVVPAAGYRHVVVDVGDTPPLVEAEVVHENRLGRDVWTVTVRLPAELERGRFAGAVVLNTEDERGESSSLSIPITGDVVEDLQASPSRLVFATPRDAAAESHVEVYSLLPGARLRVVEAEVDEEHRDMLVVECEPQAPDASGRSARWSIHLETVPPLALEAGAILAGTLHLKLDDPQHPDLDLPYVVHVR